MNGGLLFDKKKELIYHERRERRNLRKQASVYVTQFRQILPRRVLHPQCHFVMLKVSSVLSTWHCCALKRTALRYIGEEPPYPHHHNMYERGSWHVFIGLRVPGQATEIVLEKTAAQPQCLSPTSCHSDSFRRWTCDPSPIRVILGEFST